MKLHLTLHSLCAVLSTSLVLSACGGGSSDTTPTASGTPTSFKIVNNYVSGATVFRDENGDGVANGSEVSGTTDVNGDVTLTYTVGSTPVAIQSNGGSYTLDGETIEVGVLLSRDDYDVVTPLTTLFIASDPANVSVSGAALESAQNEFMAATLGVDVADLPAGLSLNIDPVTPPEGLNADTTSALSTFRVAGATIATALRAAALDGGTGIPTKDAVLAASRGVVAFVRAGNKLSDIASNSREMVVHAVAGAKNPTSSVSDLNPALVERTRGSAAALIDNIHAKSEAVRGGTESAVTRPGGGTPGGGTPGVSTGGECSISVKDGYLFNIRTGTTADLNNSEFIDVGSGVTVSLASSAENVATVSGKTITPVAEGTTTITLTGSGSSCTSKSVTFSLAVIGATGSVATGSGTGVVLSGTGTGSTD